jgi:hypothetical protein
MSKTAGDPERAVNGMLSVAQLLEEPRLARLYPKSAENLGT